METETAPEPVRLEKIGDVIRRTGLSQSAIYAAIQRGLFPQALRITPRAVAWRADEVDRWILERPRATGGKAPTKRADREAEAA